MSNEKPLREIRTFTLNMHRAMQALCNENAPVRLHQVAAKIDHPNVGPMHLISSMQALRRGGYVTRIKKRVGERQIGHRTFPVHETSYLLTDAGREAWKGYTTLSECDHDFLEHETLDGRYVKYKSCSLCGFKMRVDEEPDEQELASLTAHQTLDALAHAKQIGLSYANERRKPWHRRMYERVVAALKGVI